MKKMIINLMAIASLPLYSYIDSWDTSVCVPGKFTSSMSAARTYAAKHERPMLMVLTKTGGCNLSKNGATYIWNTSEFKNWSKQKDIPIIFGDASSVNGPADTFLDLYYEEALSMPAIVLIDGVSGKKRMGWDIVHGAGMANGDCSRNFTVDHKGVYLSPYDYTCIDNVVTFYLNKSDDEISASGRKSIDYGCKAHEITPNSPKDKTLRVNGLWGSMGVNDLSSKIYKAPSGSYVCTQSDERDWYKFTCATAGTGYIIKAPTLKDTKGLGYIGIYTNAATAKAATDFAKAKSTKYGAPAVWAAMSTLKNGLSFTAPKAGTIYILFTRDKVGSTDKVTLEYTFTIQEGIFDAFQFSKSNFEFDEYNTNATDNVSLSSVITNDCSLTLTRAGTGSKTTAYVKFSNGRAKKGTDYLVVQTNVTFEATSKTANLPVKIISERGVWKNDRDFTVSILRDGKEGGILSSKVTIKDVDQATDSFDPIDDSEEAAQTISIGSAITNRLNGIYSQTGYDDTVDNYCIQVPADDEIAVLTVTALTLKNVDQIGVAYPSANARATSATECLSSSMPVFTADIPPAAFANGPARISISRTAAAASADICAIYEIKVGTKKRPIVQFATGETVEFESPRQDTNVLFTVTCDQDWPYPLMPSYSTREGSAKAGFDFISVDSSLVDSNKSVCVTLKNADRWRPERSFELVLEADQNGYYALGARKTLELTIHSDSNAANSENLRVNVGETLSKTDMRNLNNTNIQDFVIFTNIVADATYVLGAEDVVIKPVDTDVKVTLQRFVNGALPPVVGSSINLIDGTESLLITNNVTVYISDNKEINRVVVATTNIFPKTEVGSVASITTITTTNGTSWIDFPGLSYELSDLSDPNKMPILNFGDYSGDVRCHVSREGGETIMAEYKLMMSRWQGATYSFSAPAFTNSQESTNFEYPITRTGDLQLPAKVYATLVCETARDDVDVAAFEDLPIEFAAGQSEATLTVENLMYKTPNIWKGDRTFRLSLSSDDFKLTGGAYTNVLVVTTDPISEFEEGDSKDESEVDPTTIAEITSDVQRFDRTLNGADSEDWFRFTNLVTGRTYRVELTIDEASTNDVKSIGMFVSYDGQTVTNKNEALLGKPLDFIPEQSEEILVRVSRSKAGNSASMKYAISVREWPWPTFAFETEEMTVSDAVDSVAIIKILRLENVEGTNEVTFALSAMTNTLVSGTEPQLGTKETFKFLPGVAETNIAIRINQGRGTEGIWTGDWCFSADLSVTSDTSIEKVRLGTPSHLIVRVESEVSQYDWHDELGDDTPETLTRVDAMKAVSSVTDECRLNGDDEEDWFRFSDIKESKSYYFAIDVSKVSNLDASGIQMSFWQEVDGVLHELQEESGTPGVVKAITDGDIYVKVYRASGQCVSVAYTLSYRLVSAWVALVENQLKVSEAASEVKLKVVCGSDTGLALPVVAVLYPEVQDGDTATVSSDFDATPVEVSWPVGLTGISTNEVTVKLTNFDSTWEAAEETFHIRLVAKSGAEATEAEGMYTNALVTIVEKDPIAYGNVGVTGVGDPIISVTDTSTTVFPGREGSNVVLRVKRKNGLAGDVVMKWYWKDSSGNTVKFDTGSYWVTTNFVEGVKGSMLCEIPVPVKNGFVASEKWTLAYKLASTDVQVSAGTPKSVAFKIIDKDYGGKLSAYSTGDLSRIAFTTTDASWYTALNGASVRATPPAASGTSKMSATVKGPGMLLFDVAFENVENGSYLKVSGGESTVTCKTNGSYSVGIVAGTQVLSFVFKRAKADSDFAAVELKNVQFIPATEYNMYGTFTGPVVIEGIAGQATATVATSGKLSGKFVCANRTWTFSSSEEWLVDEGAEDLPYQELVAKSGTRELEIRLQIDIETGTMEIYGMDVFAELYRVVWNDKPVSEDYSAVLNPLAGNYNVMLTGEGFGSHELEFNVTSKGVVSGTVVLPNNEKVALTGKVVFADGVSPVVYFFATSASYPKGWLAFVLGFEVSDDDVTVVLPDLGVMDDIWNWCDGAGTEESLSIE